MTRVYIVVEKAGYVGENDVYRNESFSKCHEWMKKTYDADELDEFGPNSLHVAIACERDGERTYEI